MNIDADKVITSLAVKLANSEVQAVKYETLAEQLQEKVFELQSRNAELEARVIEFKATEGTDIEGGELV